MAQAAGAGMSIEARCDNWGLAHRLRLIQGEAESFEGAYRSPQQWHELGAPAESQFVDPHDAREVESAVCVLPIYQHAILRAWHVYRASPAACLRLAAKAAGESRGRLGGWASTLGASYGLLAHALSLPVVIRKERARERVARLLGPLPASTELINAG
jgi:hypothetical protein